MIAIVRALSRAFPETQADTETFKTIALFCGVGLDVTLLMATNGLDMSVGFF
jgi:ribose/xylose/arabinose/galactoside ABC-type transport system permease subunit